MNSEAPKGMFSVYTSRTFVFISLSIKKVGIAKKNNPPWQDEGSELQPFPRLRSGLRGTQEIILFAHVGLQGLDSVCSIELLRGQSRNPNFSCIVTKCGKLIGSLASMWIS
jgi:hypothetical protein